MISISEYFYYTVKVEDLFFIYSATYVSKIQTTSFEGIRNNDFYELEISGNFKTK